MQVFFDVAYFLRINLQLASFTIFQLNHHLAVKVTARLGIPALINNLKIVGQLIDQCLGLVRTIHSNAGAHNIAQLLRRFVALALDLFLSRRGILEPWIHNLGLVLWYDSSLASFNRPLRKILEKINKVSLSLICAIIDLSH